MSCEYCDFESSPERLHDDWAKGGSWSVGLVGRDELEVICNAEDQGHDFEAELYLKVNYCPMCGEKLGGRADGN